MRLRLPLAWLLTVVVTVSPAAQEDSDDAAARARDKIESIIARSEAVRAGRSDVSRIVLTEAEINAWLDVDGGDTLPAAIAEPEIRFGGDDEVRARAVIDLDQVRASRQRSWRDPLAYVAGAVEVVASGRVTAEDGIARAELESATVAGLSVPASVVRELVRFFTTTPERPDGVDLNQPFELPADIRRVVVRRGHAVIVQ